MPKICHRQEVYLAIYGPMILNYVTNVICIQLTHNQLLGLLCCYYIFLYDIYNIYVYIILSMVGQNVKNKGENKIRT